jgi:hypothetical protein
MQHEDGSGACENRPQQVVSAAEIKHVQAGANDVVAKLPHCMPGRLLVEQKLAGKH